MRPLQDDVNVANITRRMSSGILSAATDEDASRAFRDGFLAIRSIVDLHPEKGRKPSQMLRLASTTIRELAADCLPLGVAVGMHLYPYCALHWFPLPALSAARFRRDMLARGIRRHGLLLANAGGARSVHSAQRIQCRRAPNGLSVDGVFEYMSLASVADRVLFRAPIAGTDSSAMCIANLRGQGIGLGPWKFTDSMRLSDTAALNFDNHQITEDAFAIEDTPGRIASAFAYQRAWSHLLLAESHLARLQRLYDEGLARFKDEQIASLDELAHLGRHAGDLLDDHTHGGAVDRLLQVSASIKLRTSILSSAVAQRLHEREDLKPGLARPHELRYIRLQPTSDPEILREQTGRTHLSIVAPHAPRRAVSP